MGSIEANQEERMEIAGQAAMVSGGASGLGRATAEALTAAGVTLKSVFFTSTPEWLGLALYIGMGWLALIAIRPLWLRLPLSGWLWLIAGGLAYTAGVAFYACDRRLRYAHFVWHLFVLTGTTCHFFAVLWYAM